MLAQSTRTARCMRRSVFVRLFSTGNEPRVRRSRASNVDTENNSDGGFEIEDDLDEVFGTESFGAPSPRKEDRGNRRMEAQVFKEYHNKPPYMITLSDRKYQALDPRDYLLDDGDLSYAPVDPQEYVVAGTGVDPEAHTSADSVGKYFPMGNVVEGFAKGLDEELETTEEQLLMIREPAVRVIRSLQAFEQGNYSEGPDPAIVLSGGSKTGKSATLAHVVDYARSNGWLTLFIPRMKEILHDSAIVEPSFRRPGFFDQLNFCRDVVQNFAKANSSLLGDVQIKTKDDPETQGRLDSLSTLEDMVQQFNSDDPSIDPVGLTLDLFRELAAATEFPVLIAVDDYNHCYEPTGYWFEGERVMPDKLTLVHALQHFKPADPSKPTGDYVYAPDHPIRNGVLITAEAHHRPTLAEDEKEFGTIWKNIGKAASLVKHKRFSLAETESCMRHLFHSGLCFFEPTSTAVQTLHLLTDGIPAEVRTKAALENNFLVDLHLPIGPGGRLKNEWNNFR